MNCNNFIVTRSGLHLNLLSPKSNEIRIGDIAHALSLICRFTGHSSRFYSVAEHSIQCALLVPAPLRLEALLHDATEAYLGDVSRPLKDLLPAYKSIENNLDSVIRRKFKLPLEHSLEVKEADMIMLVTEARELRLRGWKNWANLPKPSDKVMFYDRCDSPWLMAERFLFAFQTYSRIRNDGN